MRFVGRDTREPSPFSYELLNANPYAFLDGAPLEERRVRAVATRRTLSSDELRDLASFDPAAIAQVRARSLAAGARRRRTARRAVEPGGDRRAGSGALGGLARRLDRAGPRHARRAGRPERPVDRGRELAGLAGRVSRRRRPIRRSTLPERLRTESPRHEAITALVRGRVEHSGPTTAAEIGEFLGLRADTVAGVARSPGRARRRAARQLSRSRAGLGKPTATARPVVRPAAVGADSSAHARRACGSRFGRSSRASLCTFWRAIIA